MVTTATNITSPSYDGSQAAANEAANKSKTAEETTTSDYETFLQLMTTQMKNQDPLKPMDSTEFVSQLAQFSGVEQQVNMNQKLEALITAVAGSQFDEAALYLGKDIKAATGKVEVTDTNTPEISYKTPDGTAKSDIIIRDAYGTVVDQIQVTPSLTEKTVKWDKLGLDGQLVKNGTYIAEIVHTNNSGTQTTDKALTRNKVVEVIRTDVGYELKTSQGDLVKLENVVSLANN